jgi:hypothetical protein
MIRNQGPSDFGLRSCYQALCSSSYNSFGSHDLRLRPQHLAGRQPRNARDDALAFRFAFAQSNASEWRICKHTIPDQPIVRGAIPSGEIVPDDPKVVFGHVSELWAAGAFSDGPNVGMQSSPGDRSHESNRGCPT